MLLSRFDRHIATTFLSILTFVFMILVATMVPGLNGAQVAHGIALPLKNPYLVLGSLFTGVIAGRFRSISLFLLPLSYCMGLVVGLIILSAAFAGMMVYACLILAILLWVGSLYLITTPRFMMTCIVFIGVALLLASTHIMPQEMYGYMFYVLLGLLLSVLLLGAIGVCLVIAMIDMERLFPEFHLKMLMDGHR